MLILQRRPGESLRIGEDIEVSVVSMEGGKVRLAISAPRDITILRSELIGARDTNRDAVMEQVVSADLFTMLDELLPTVGGKSQPLSLKPLKSNDPRE